MKTLTRDGMHGIQSAYTREKLTSSNTTQRTPNKPIALDENDLESFIIDERKGFDADVKNLQQLSTNIKVIIFNTNVEIALLYKAETSTTTTTIIEKAQVFIWTILVGGLCSSMRVDWRREVIRDVY
ncbi:unnamed protein product [Schistosoma mattheei]|uniref:Uncharacterized protein n=1 Tax=Schistosoma mattheei TaxID=31246 RepID=A0A183NK56_9TREM|nr:unnamed protein product [Schistosoma mattheei]